MYNSAAAIQPSITSCNIIEALEARLWRRRGLYFSLHTAAEAAELSMQSRNECFVSFISRDE